MLNAWGLVVEMLGKTCGSNTRFMHMQPSAPTSLCAKQQFMRNLLGALEHSFSHSSHVFFNQLSDGLYTLPTGLTKTTTNKYIGDII